MIRAKLITGDYLFGFSRKNVEKLMAGQPILIRGDEIQLPFNVFVLYGETEQAIVDDLNKNDDQVNEIH